MIEYDRKNSDADAQPEDFNIRIFGIGGAGANVIDSMIGEGMDPDSLVTMNTDARALTESKAGRKVQLGRNLTMGLGCGGDPELGREAALEVEEEIRSVVRGCGMVFLCAGLGGGTGSGATPIVARVAREEGCFVVVFATLPFHFEGRRRIQQANMALSELRGSANALLTFENNRMGELIVPKDGVEKAFQAADETICQSVRAISNLVEQPGMIRIGMDDLLAVLRGSNARCLFGFGRATGKDRPQEALEQALANPLLDRGQLLEHTTNVLAHISGGPGMTLKEVEDVMRVLSSHVDEETQILFGVSSNKNLGDSLCVTIISSLDQEAAARPVASVHATTPETVPRRREAPSVQEEPPVPADLAPEPEAEPTAESSPTVEQKIEFTPDPEPESQPFWEESRDLEPEAVEPVEEQAPEVSEPLEYQASETTAFDEKPASASEPVLEEESDLKVPPVEFRTAPDPEPADLKEVEEKEAPPLPPRRNRRRRTTSLEFEAAEEDQEPVSAPDPGPHPDPGREETHQEARKPFKFEVRQEMEAREARAQEAAPARETPAPASTPEPEEKEEAPMQSIFQVVDSPKQPDAGPAVPKPKVKIEFSSEEDEAENRTITLDQPMPSRGRDEERQRAQAPNPMPASKAGPGFGEVMGFQEAEVATDEDDALTGAEAGRRRPDNPQQMLDLDPPARGRFDKGEPTIVDGQDLDIPTFLRKRKRA